MYVRPAFAVLLLTQVLKQKIYSTPRVQQLVSLELRDAAKSLRSRATEFNEEG